MSRNATIGFDSQELFLRFCLRVISTYLTKKQLCTSGKRWLMLLTERTDLFEFSCFKWLRKHQVIHFLYLFPLCISSICPPFLSCYGDLHNVSRFNDVFFFCLFVSQVVHSSSSFCPQDVSTWIQTGFWTSSWRYMRVGLTRMTSFCLSSSPTCVSHSPSATSSVLSSNSTRWEEDSRTESLNIFDFTLTNSVSI